MAETDVTPREEPGLLMEPDEEGTSGPLPIAREVLELMGLPITFS
jgi:hypothetical protein